jgi:hypothetical protein
MKIWKREKKFESTSRSRESIRVSYRLRDWLAMKQVDQEKMANKRQQK